MNIYHCHIQDASQVYDADTIKDVRISTQIVELDVGVYIVRDIRIKGIDTPESRPRRAGRTEASLEREKQASAKARHALVNLLSENNFEFNLLNIELGKYAGRVVGTMLIGNINVAQYLIHHGHAKPYDGRTKPNWDF